MPSVPHPNTLQNYLEPLTGPGEQHEVEHTISDLGHCVNPKCKAEFDPQALQDAEWDNWWYVCPKCGFRQNLYGGDEQTQTQIWHTGPDGNPVMNPGGLTSFSLTPKEMGDIGEGIVGRLGELPGIGSIQVASNSINFPIDFVIGRYGVEVKTTHSQATPIFKVGDRAEKNEKIEHCLKAGLKPALVGVRLNFFTDLAYVFFREGLVDTAISNPQMKHVGTYNFADLNPFKSPNPQARAIEIEQAHLPESDDEFGGVFGKTASDDFEQNHPRNESGEFTFKNDVHEMKVHDRKGKHIHTLKRCKHCGFVYGKLAEHKGRMECPTCGEDPERKLSLAKVILAAGAMPADKMAEEIGWRLHSTNKNGHRVYSWGDPEGTIHTVLVGSGQHNKAKDEMDGYFLRQRATKCMNGQCNHVPVPMGIDLGSNEEALFKVGDTVHVNPNSFGLVLNIDGEMALVQNFQTGKKDYIPTTQLQVAASDRLGEVWQQEKRSTEWQS